MAKNGSPLALVLYFLFPGLVFGLVFGCLTRWDAMIDFWFLRGDKFLFPTYKYWAGASLTLSLSIWTGYALANLRDWSADVRSPSRRRVLGIAILMICAGPILELIREAMDIRPSILWDFFVLPSVTFGMIPIGLRLWTRRWESLLAALMLLVVIVCVFGGYVVGGLLAPLRPARDLLPVIQMSFEVGVIVALTGMWLFKPSYTRVLASERPLPT